MSELVFEERLDQVETLTPHNLCVEPREVGGCHVKLRDNLAAVQQPPDIVHFRNAEGAAEFCSHISVSALHPRRELSR